VRCASVASEIKLRAEQTRTASSGSFIVVIRSFTMPRQFENPKAAKLKNNKVSDTSSEKKTQLVAEKAAEKSTKTVQKFDSDNRQLFSK
jgi:hypothetical protein